MITIMTIKDDDKGDEQKAQRSKNNSRESKNISSESRTSQEFKNQEEFKTSRSSIKNPIQDSRFKRKNQEATSQDFI